MVRHIQAVAGASSARWIGALSLKPYREFVDSFLANDSEAFDGDGLHALTRNKKLVDMIGITHFTQLLDYGQTNDPMLTQGYELVREADTGESLIRLYKNPDAYPKAYIVPKGEFVAADDEIRFRLRDPLYDPRAVVYISGSTPPIETTPSSTPLIASATITNYTNIRVDIETTSDRDAFLVLTDSSSNEWQTFIDNVPALPLKANSIFKTIQHAPSLTIQQFDTIPRTNTYTVKQGQSLQKSVFMPSRWSAIAVRYVTAPKQNNAITATLTITMNGQTIATSTTSTKEILDISSIDGQDFFTDTSWLLFPIPNIDIDQNTVTVHITPNNGYLVVPDDKKKSHDPTIVGFVKTNFAQRLSC